MQLSLKKVLQSHLFLAAGRTRLPQCLLPILDHRFITPPCRRPQFSLSRDGGRARLRQTFSARPASPRIRLDFWTRKSAKSIEHDSNGNTRGVSQCENKTRAANHFSRLGGSRALPSNSRLLLQA